MQPCGSPNYASSMNDDASSPVLRLPAGELEGAVRTALAQWPRDYDRVRQLVTDRSAAEMEACSLAALRCPNASLGCRSPRYATCSSSSSSRLSWAPLVSAQRSALLRLGRRRVWMPSSTSASPSQYPRAKQAMSMSQGSGLNPPEMGRPDR